MKLKVLKLRPDAILPTKGYSKSVGLDLYAVENYKILPGEVVKIHTGIAVQIDNDNDNNLIAGLIWDRSSLGSKGIHRLAGVIDIDEYTGEWIVCLTNLNIANTLNDLLFHAHAESYGSQCIIPDVYSTWKQDIYSITRGDKVAQVLIQQVINVEIEEVTSLETTARAAGGFGSTGN